MESKTRNPKQIRSKQKKSKIIKSALKVFSEKGYYNITSKDIAKEAGVSIGTFYAYFNDKKEVFIHLLDEYKSRMNDRVQQSIINNKLCEQENNLIKIVLNTIIDTISEYPKGFYTQIRVLKETDIDIKKEYNLHLNSIISFIDKELNIRGTSTSKSNTGVASFVVKLNESVVHMIINEENHEMRAGYIEMYKDMLGKYLLSIQT